MCRLRATAIGRVRGHVSRHDRSAAIRLSAASDTSETRAGQSREVGVVIRERKAVRRMERVFKDDWSKTSQPKQKS
jgi:hypothetical protein